MKALEKYFMLSTWAYFETRFEGERQEWQLYKIWE